MPLVTRKISLYKNTSQRIILEYSAFKFGEPKIIAKYARQMTWLIKAYMKPGEKYLIHATTKRPLNRYYQKNAYLLANLVAKKLKLPLLVGEYSYKYQAQQFYDNQSAKKRRSRPIILQNKKHLAKEKYHVLMIDDSIVSGASFRSSISALRSISRAMTLFYILDLKKIAVSEKKINNACLEKQGRLFLLKLLGNKHYILTSHFLRAFYDLSTADKKWLLSHISLVQQKSLNQALIMYKRG